MLLINSNEQLLVMFPYLLGNTITIHQLFKISSQEHEKMSKNVIVQNHGTKEWDMGGSGHPAFEKGAFYSHGQPERDALGVPVLT